jgi:hypothetical protein
MVGASGVPNSLKPCEGQCHRRRSWAYAADEFPVVGEDGMPRRSSSESTEPLAGRLGPVGTAKAAGISRKATKSRCAGEWGGWGRQVMMDRDSITRTGARAPGAWRYSRKWLAPTQCGEKQHALASAKRGSQLRRRHWRPAGRLRVNGQPWSRTGENPPYGILGGTMETSASFEVRSAPSS